MIQPRVPSVPLMQMTQTNIPKAPKSAHMRRPNNTILVHLTYSFVFGLMGFQSRFPYGL